MRDRFYSWSKGETVNFLLHPSGLVKPFEFFDSFSELLPHSPSRNLYNFDPSFLLELRQKLVRLYPTPTFTTSPRSSTSKVCLYLDLLSRSASPQIMSSKSTQQGLFTSASQVRRKTAKMSFWKFVEVMDEMRFRSCSRGCAMENSSSRSSGQFERLGEGFSGRRSSC
jgi:hypothetical protein